MISALLGLAVQLFPVPAFADYVLYKGDVLDISSSTSPEMSRRTAVGDNGKISLPVIGEIDAAGLSLPQLRAKMQDLLAAKNIRTPDVTIEIVGHRPVYVVGDVAAPGPYPFRPGMTVRDAVSLADAAQALQLNNTRGDGVRLAAGLVDQSVRVARLQAALSGQTEIDVKRIPTGPIAPTYLSELIFAHNQQLKTEQEEFDKQTAYLQRMIKETQAEISALDQAQQGVAKDVEHLQKDSARMRELLQSGIVQITRVEEQQRAISAAVARLFDVMARATAARKELERLNWQMQEAGDKRKIQNLQELELALGQVATTRALLASGGENLSLTGAATPQASHAGRQARHFVIVRDKDRQPERTEVSEATVVLPGDTIEVRAVTTTGALGGAAPVAAPASN